MRKLVFSILMLLAASVVSSVVAQGPPQGAGTPAGGGDKNLADEGIKMRSVELERMKKEGGQSEAGVSAPINKQIVTKFPEIKEDYEGIQIAQDSIIKAYSTGKDINYGVISASAEAIAQKARRLDSNLFAESKEKNEQSASDKAASKNEKPKSIRDLIVDLDNTIGSFVSSKLFANIQVIEPDVAVSTRTDLMTILHLSEMLAAEAKKLK